MINTRGQDYLKAHVSSRLSGFDAEYTNLSIRVDVLSSWHQHRNSRRLTRERHGSEAFVAFLIKFYHNYRRQDWNSQNEVELEHCIYNEV